jgi:hypothetical protein
MRHRHFRPLAGAIALASIVSALSGCGGSGRTSAQGGAGAFAKTFTGEIDDHSGGLQPINITVSPDGTVNGSSGGFTVGGTLTRDGHAMLDVAGGTLIGTFNQPNGATIYAKLYYTATRQTVYAVLLVSPSSTNEGYMGAQVNTTKGTLEPIAFGIDSNGSVTGTTEVQVGNAIEFAKVVGSIDSGWDLNLVESLNGTTVNTVTGNLVQQGLGISGNISFGNMDKGEFSALLITQ